MKRITSIRLSSSLAVILALVLFFFVNMASSFFLNSRIDLTENSIFTLSDGTHRVIEKIKEPIRMRMYYSDSLAQGLGQIQSYAQRVRGLLEQYSGISDGKIILEFIDPEPFSTEEDQAAAFGLQAVPLNNQQLYFGLAISDSVDNTEVIPFFSPERETFLEYDISRLIYDLSNPKKPKIGIISWLPSQQPQQPIFFQQLEQQYQIETIETTAATLPEGLDSLLIIHPQNDINENLSYAIDQYLLNNGKVIAFVDPLNEDRQSGIAPNSDMPNLFSAWGVKFDKTKVVGDPSLALRVTIQSPSGNRAIDHPAWLQLGEDSFNSSDPVTANLNQVRFIGSGSLSVDPSKDTVEFMPLVSSSVNSSLVNSAVLQSPNPRSWVSAMNSQGQKYSLAARYSGVFSTAFPEKSSDTHMAQSSTSSNLIVIADVDFIKDRYWVEVRNLLGQQLTIKSADNGTMVVNAVDHMVGSSDLISLRSRGVKDRNFDVVSDLRRKAEARFQDQEQKLQRKLQEAEQRINDLQRNKQSQDALILNDEQRKEILKFQRQKAQTRKELRELQLRLNRDIESLGTWLKFFNIMFIPIIILLLSFFLPSRLGLRRN